MNILRAVRSGRKSSGEFSVELDLANYQDLMQVRMGVITNDQVRRTRISGLVDTGATRLVLPPSVVSALGLTSAGQVTCQFADGREAVREVVNDAFVELLGRSATFKAIVEPTRTDALIGAIVLEELDFIVDCLNMTLVPRDPNGIISYM